MPKREEIEKKLLSAFNNGDREGFILELYVFIKYLFAEKVRLIQNILNYEEETEAIHEILSIFLSNKFNSIKKRFSNFSPEDYQSFLGSLYISISHAAKDILAQNEDYRLKQRLRKEIIKLINSHDTQKYSKKFKLIQKNNLYFIKRISEPKLNLELLRKPSNFLGISNNDILILMDIVLDEEEIFLNTAVNKCYDYLVKNGYIKLEEKYLKEREEDFCYDSNLSDKETALKVIAELENILTKNEIKIFYYYFVEGAKIKDIASKLNFSTQLTNYYKNKSIQAVQKIVNKYKGEVDRGVIKTLIEIMEKDHEKYFKK